MTTQSKEVSLEDLAEKKEKNFEAMSKSEGQITAEDKEFWRKLLAEKPIRRVLKEVLSYSDAQANALLAAPLLTERDVRTATMYQGKAQGISYAIELIYDLVYSENDEDE